ncbi:MAG: hypothetical protein KGJ78_17610 [Alphaproteobacteria bacterium]|nr:hypothetical protein [Alphaproteobacteria bacterium]
MSEDTQGHPPASVPTPKVGYRNPPVATRFKPGVSGNPKGKPKGAKTLKSVVIKTAKSKIVLKEGGTTTKLSKLEATVAILTMNALKGNAKSMSLLLALFKEHLPAETENAIKLPEPTAEDLEVLSSKAKLLELLEQASHEHDPSTGG